MQRELFAIAAAFGFLIFASRRLKLWHGVILCLTGCVMSLCAGHAPAQTARYFLSVFTSAGTVKTIAVVIEIGVLSVLMKHYGILDRLVLAFEKVFASERTIMMLLPATFGMLSVPGGAQLSSPFVNQIGQDLNMPVAKRAAVNISFRHIAYMVLPTASSMIVFSSLVPNLSVYKLIGLNIVYALIIQSAAYYVLLKDYPPTSLGRKLNRREGLWELAQYLFPIYVIILLNGLFGVQMYISVFLSLIFVALIWGRRDLGGYCRVFVSGVSLKVFIMMTGVFFMQNVIKDLGSVMGGFSALFAQSSGFAALLVLSATCIFFAATSGLSYVALGVATPLVLSLNLPPTQELLYCFAIYTMAFNGYYYSPLHLCQLLTDRKSVV